MQKKKKLVPRSPQQFNIFIAKTITMLKKELVTKENQIISSDLLLRYQMIQKFKKKKKKKKKNKKKIKKKKN